MKRLDEQLLRSIFSDSSALLQVWSRFS